MKLIKDYYYKIALFVIAGLWLLLVFFVFQIDKQNYIFGDSKSYSLAAQQLYYDFFLNDHRPLVISAINGFPLLFGFPVSSIFKWSFFVNLLCWFSVIMLIFDISKTFVRPKIAFILSLIYVFCLGNLFITFHLLSESIYTFCLVLIVHQLQKFTITSKVKHLILVVVLLILSIMIKPISMVVLILVCLFFWKGLMLVMKNKYSVFIYLSLMILFYQMNGLKKEYGNFTVSYIDSYTYYNYLGSRAEFLKKGIEFKQESNERKTFFSTLTNSQQKEEASKDLKKQITENPINLIKAYFINLYINSTKGSAAVFSCQNRMDSSFFEGFHFLVKVLSKIQNIVFTLLGLLISTFIILRWKKNEKISIFISSVILTVIGVSAISSDQGDRFHLVLYPIILILIVKKKESVLISFGQTLSYINFRKPKV